VEPLLVARAVKALLGTVSTAWLGLVAFQLLSVSGSGSVVYKAGSMLTGIYGVCETPDMDGPGHVS
jgi:hypothetical protein